MENGVEAHRRKRNMLLYVCCPESVIFLRVTALGNKVFGIRNILAVLSLLVSYKYEFCLELQLIWVFEKGWKKSEKHQLIAKELHVFIFCFSCWLVLGADTWIIQTIDFLYDEFLRSGRKPRTCPIFFSNKNSFESHVDSSERIPNSSHPVNHVINAFTGNCFGVSLPECFCISE